MRTISLLFLCSVLFLQMVLSQGIKMVPLHSGGLYLYGNVSNGELTFSNGATVGMQGAGCFPEHYNFLARTDTAGNVLWVKRFGEYVNGYADEWWYGSSAGSLCLDIAVDSADNVYIGGWQGGLYWEGLSNPVISEASPFYEKYGFIGKISPLGDAIWFTKLPPFTPHESYPALAGIATGGGYVYTAIHPDRSDTCSVIQLSATTGVLTRTAQLHTTRPQQPSIFFPGMLPMTLAADPQGNCYLAGQSGTDLWVNSSQVAGNFTDTLSNYIDRVPFGVKLDSLLGNVHAHLPGTDASAGAPFVEARWDKIAWNGDTLVLSGYVWGDKPMLFGPQSIGADTTGRKHLLFAAFDTSWHPIWVRDADQQSRSDVHGMENAIHPAGGESLLLAWADDYFWPSWLDSVKLAPLDWSLVGSNGQHIVARLAGGGEAMCAQVPQQRAVSDLTYDAYTHDAWLLMRNYPAYEPSKWYLSRWDSCGGINEMLLAAFIPGVSIDPAHTAAFTLSPNPASDHTEVRLAQPAHSSPTASLHSVQGQCVWQGQLDAIGDETYRLPLGNLPPGLYLLTIPGYGAGKLMVVR